MKLLVDNKHDIPLLLQNGNRARLARLQIFAYKMKESDVFVCYDTEFSCTDGVFYCTTYGYEENFECSDGIFQGIDGNFEVLVYYYNYNDTNGKYFVMVDGDRWIPLVMDNGRKAKLARLSMFAYKNPVPILTLYSPSGEVVDTESFEIQWLQENCLGFHTVRIELVQNDTVIDVIAQNVVATTGSYTWNTTEVLAGEYKIRIILEQLETITSESVIFTLARSISLDSIVSPVDVSPYEITWSTVNVRSDAMIRLDLYDDEYFVRTLDTVENTGSYDWYNEDDEVSVAYSVLATMVDMEEVWDRSNQFELARSITLVQPISGTVSQANYEIQWSTVNISASKTIRIEWIKGLETVLIAEVLNTGSYTWNNVSLDGGDYQIKLSLVEV